MGGCHQTEVARQPDACRIRIAVRDAEAYGPKRATILKRVRDGVKAWGSVGDRTSYRHCVLPRLRLVVPPWDRMRTPKHGHCRDAEE